MADTKPCTTVQPRVMLVCPTADRPQFAARMLASFHSQTYDNKLLFILDSGRVPLHVDQQDGVYYEYMPHKGGQPIGALRNEANSFANPRCLNADIIAHLDVDDWSHPNRITEQVALLEASGKECVGYRDMLFWKECPQCHGFDDYCADVATCETCKRAGGEAWLYSNGNTRYALGTSLCYWRRTWERNPFDPDKPATDQGQGEDDAFLKKVSCYGVTSTGKPPTWRELNDPAGRDTVTFGDGTDGPRMIASVHGGNTSSIPALAIRLQSSEVKRRPDLDQYCRERMAL